MTLTCVTCGESPIAESTDLYKDVTLFLNRVQRHSGVVFK